MSVLFYFNCSQNTDLANIRGWNVIGSIPFNAIGAQVVNEPINSFSEILFLIGTNTGNYLQSALIPIHIVRQAKLINFSKYCTSPTYGFDIAFRITVITPSGFTLSVDEYAVGSAYSNGFLVNMYGK